MPRPFDSASGCTRARNVGTGGQELIRPKEVLEGFSRARWLDSSGIITRDTFALKQLWPGLNSHGVVRTSEAE